MKITVAVPVASLPVVLACKLLFLFGLLFPLSSSAQFLRYRNYDVDDGLPSSEVYDMLQDSRGFIWFATDMGVSRYDGYTFTTFTTDNGLPDNTIFNIYEDYCGRIWFTSFSGRLCYFSDGRMHSLPCNEKLKTSLKFQVILSLYVDRNDTVWVGTTRNLFLKIAPDWGAEQVDSVITKPLVGYIALIDTTGIIYGGSFGARQDITVSTKSGRSLYTVNVMTKLPPISGPRYTVARMPDGTFLVTANEFITAFNQQGIISRDTMKATGICTLVEPGGSVLVGTYDGVYCWDGAKLIDQQEISRVKNKIVTCILRDRENGTWYCTEGNGVYYVANTSFLYYTEEDGLSASKITAAATVGQTICLGHIDGTISFLNGTSIRSMSTDNWNAAPGSPSRIGSLLAYDDQQLIASTGNNIFLIDAMTLTSRMINRYGAKKLIRSKDGSVWAFQFRRLVNLRGTEFVVAANHPFQLYADNIFEDRNGLIWMCAIDGIWNYDSINGYTSRGETDSLLSVRITDVDESADGIMWFASRGSGIIAKTPDSTYQVTVHNGLAGNMCRAVYVDTGNTIWVATNNGLSRIYYSTSPSFHYTVVTYTMDAGLLTNDVNDVLRIGDNLALIHTSSVSVFDPRELESNSFVPPVYLMAATQENDSSFSEGAQFGFDQDYFTFNYVGLSFRDPGQMRYRYKMEGADEVWRTTTTTSATYQALPPGNYRFVVQASTDGNLWSNDASIHFAILPAWWQSWLFRAGVLILGTLLVYLLFRWRINTVQKRHMRKAQLQSRMTTFELNALRAQMNPHFVFNAINSVQYFITANDPDSSQKYLSKFAKLIRYVVDNARLSYIPIRSEVEALKLYLELEALRFGNRLKYSFEISENVDAEYDQIPSMLIQPYVENAIWHGIMHKQGDGEIKIRLSKLDNIISCVIEDNGVGRSKSMELKKSKMASNHKSVGMSNTRERLEIINQLSKTELSVEITDLYSDAGEPGGTRIQLRIPLNHQ